jgi:oligosaccharide amylase
MAVFQPTAIIGNGRVLVTLGHSAELMAFFYPRCDHAQNVREGLTGIYLDGFGFSWLFGQEWQRQQRYLKGEAAVLTELTSPLLGLGVSVCDFVSPNEPVLFRQWQVRSLDGKPKRLRLLHYFELTLGGHEWQQAVQVITLPHPTPRPAVVQWRGNFWFGVSSDLPFQQWQCGKALPNAHNHPKPDMLDGWLNGQTLEIGKVAFALGWQISVPPFGSAERTMVIAFGESKREVVHRLGRNLAYSFDAHHERHRVEWREWLKRVKVSSLNSLNGERAKSVLEAALWTMRLTWDKGMGAPVAAPEFDPTFEASGGYGFCWCRDASFVAHAFAQLGLAQKASRFFDWCSKSQSPDGYFNQRYWLDGSLAPAWSEDHDNLQVDETATVVWAAAKVYSKLKEKPNQQVWESIKRALKFLSNHLVAGIHKVGMDLWETFRGHFTYTQAAFVAAFQAGAELANLMGEQNLAKQYQALAQETKSALLKRFWTKEGFLRGFTPDGHPDPTPDASILGVIEPFCILDLTKPEERAMAEGAVQRVLSHLTKETPEGGLAVWRFSGDGYAWGMASTPATLWLGLSAAALGEATGKRDWWQIAKKCWLAVTHHTTPAGLVAEMFDPFSSSYWAVGHGWSAAWLVLLTERLAEAQRKLNVLR